MLSLAKAAKDYYLQKLGELSPRRTTTCEVAPRWAGGLAMVPRNWTSRGPFQRRAW